MRMKKMVTFGMAAACVLSTLSVASPVKADEMCIRDRSCADPGRDDPLLRQEYHGAGDQCHPLYLYF